MVKHKMVDENAQLRADLANASANWQDVLADHASRGLRINSLERELAETKAALEEGKATIDKWHRWHDEVAEDRDTIENARVAAWRVVRSLEKQLEASRAETAAAQARIAEIAEQSESWRKAHNAWQRWAATWLRELGLQPEGGELGDDPARVELQSAMAAQSALRARIAELEQAHACLLDNANNAVAATGAAETALAALRERVEKLCAGSGIPGCEPPIVLTRLVLEALRG